MRSSGGIAEWNGRGRGRKKGGDIQNVGREDGGGNGYIVVNTKFSMFLLFPNILVMPRAPSLVQ